MALGIALTAEASFEANYRTISAHATPNQLANQISAFLHGEVNGLRMTINTAGETQFTEGLLGESLTALNREVLQLDTMYR